jgi:hypothetical protein
VSQRLYRKNSSRPIGEYFKENVFEIQKTPCILSVLIRSVQRDANIHIYKLYNTLQMIQAQNISSRTSSDAVAFSVAYSTSNLLYARYCILHVRGRLVAGLLVIRRPEA